MNKLYEISAPAAPPHAPPSNQVLTPVQAQVAWGNHDRNPELGKHDLTTPHHKNLSTVWLVTLDNVFSPSDSRICP